MEVLVLRGRLSTVDLIVLTSLDQLVFLIGNIIFFFTKQATLMRRPSVLSLPPQLVFPAASYVIVNRADGS